MLCVSLIIMEQVYTTDMHRSSLSNQSEAAVFINVKPRDRIPNYIWGDTTAHLMRTIRDYNQDTRSYTPLTQLRHVFI